MLRGDESVGLQTRHVFLDTQVFRALRHNPYSGPLKTLRSYVDDGVFHLHTTDITLREIQRQLGSMQGEMVARANKAARELEQWNRRFRIYSPQFVAPETIVIRDNPSPAYQEFVWVLLHELNATQHDTGNLLIGPVLDQYFGRKPPFDTDNSKEFPDAIALQALEQWCRQYDEKMYVVSKDKAVQRAAEGSPYLVPIESIDQLMSLMLSADEHEVALEVVDAFESDDLNSELEEFLKSNIGWVGSVYDGDKHDAEILHTEVANLESVDSVTVLRVDADQIACVVHVSMHVFAEVSFTDFSGAMWDKEDGIYFGAETAAVEVEDTVHAKLYVELSRNAGYFRLEAANFITRDLTISDFHDDGFPYK